MSEKLIIKNFAGIKDAEIDINKINILIGPEAVGKSIIAKLLYFFKSFPEEIINCIGSNDITIKFERKLLQKFFSFFPLRDIGTKDYLIEYELDKIKFEIKDGTKNSEEIRLEYSDYLNEILLKMNSDFMQIIPGKSDAQQMYEQFGRKKDELYRLLAQNMESPSGYRQIYIPSGRSYFSNIQRSPFFHQKEIPIDLLLLDFGSNLDIAKLIYYHKKESAVWSSEQSEIEKPINNILGGTLIKEQDREYLLHNDGRKVSIDKLSSGQQEFLPLSLILRETDTFTHHIGCTFYIEEPEAHLFPSTQKKIIELMAYIFNETSKPLQFFITTHSPYILTSFNNLMEAGIVQNKAKGDAVKLKKLYDIVPQEQILDPSAVNAYNVTHDGIKSIIDTETGLIWGDEIDGVSDIISDQYGKLLELE